MRWLIRTSPDHRQGRLLLRPGALVMEKIEQSNTGISIKVSDPAMGQVESKDHNPSLLTCSHMKYFASKFHKHLGSNIPGDLLRPFN
jgi:DNA-binding XRE family transcriptional regulator